jgi:WD40 repeat protein
VSLSADGSTLAAGGDDNKVTLYDTASKTVVATFKHEEAVRGVSLSADGSTLTAGGDDNKVMLYDTASKTVVATFEHEGAVYGVSLSADGRRLAAGGRDKKVALYAPDRVKGFIPDTQFLLESLSRSTDLLKTCSMVRQHAIYIPSAVLVTVVKHPGQQADGLRELLGLSGVEWGQAQSAGDIVLLPNNSCSNSSVWIRR